jgi:hypothetical protein
MAKRSTRKRRHRRAKIYAGRDAKITFGGVELPDARVTVERWSAPEPLPRPPSGAYDVTVEMTLEDPTKHELAELAARAVETPSLSARAALDVLADALIERGLVTDPSEAWAWAVAHASDPFDVFIRGLIARGTLGAP